jgi:hypothetical protein
LQGVTLFLSSFDWPMRNQNEKYGLVLDDLVFSRDGIDMSASSVIQFAGLDE